MKLEHFTDEELVNELKRRRYRYTSPKPLENPNYDSIKSFALNVVSNIIKNGNHNSDDIYYAFETVMEAVYGNDFWEWYNNAIK